MTVSRIEHGQIGSLTHRTLERVAAVLEIRLDFRARWHAADLDRLAGRDHSLLVESLAVRLRGDGWLARAEVSFQIWGDRGAIDLLAWHPATRALLVVEVKTEIVDVGEMLRTLDVKVRRAREIAVSLGWSDAATVSAALAIAATRTNHRRVAAHAETIRSALPDTGRELAGLLRGKLARPVRALAYMPISHGKFAGHRSAGVQRVARGRATRRDAA